MTDPELLADYARTRSEDAFAELVRRHAGRVYSACLRVLGEPHAAEDAVQATFAILARRAGKLSASTVLAGWLYVVARRAALSISKEKARQARREREAAEMRSAEIAGRMGSWEAVAPQLDAAMAALPAAQREVVLLRHCYGRSEAEAAAELGWGRSRVSVTLARAMERLRAALSRRGVSAPAAALAAMLAGPAAAEAPEGLVAAVTASVSGGAASSAQAALAVEAVLKAMAWGKAKVIAAVLLASAAAVGGGVAGARAVIDRGPVLAELPANSWVCAPERGEIAELRRRLELLSGRPRPKGSDWLFVEGWPVYSSAAGGVWLPERRAALFVTSWASGSPTAGAHLYDPAASAKVAKVGWGTASGWTDLKPEGEPVPGPLRWAALCYDPVNREVLLSGGNCPGAGNSPGTMIYDVAGNNWRHLDFSGLPLFKAQAECEALRMAARRLEGRLRGRRQLAETAAEAAEDLGSAARDLSARATALAAGLSTAAAADEQEAEGADWAKPELDAAAAAIAGVGATADVAAIAKAAEAAERLGAARDLLAVEPPARANSPMAFDAVSGRILLFGGDRLDSLCADTWSYDCAARRWRQLRPAVSPSPRAGHALVPLPESGRVVLLGGYGYEAAPGGSAYRALPLKLWTLRPDGGSWDLVTRWDGPGLPVSPAAGVLQAAAGPEDVILCGKLACRVDPTAADPGAAAAHGAAPGTVVRRGGKVDPAWWDKVAVPDPAAVEKALADIPPNTWVAVKPPASPDREHPLCTAAFDTDRRQLLVFGGGRSGYTGTDVAMYSTRAGTWRIGAAPEMPVGFIGSPGHNTQPRSFAGRPFISSHVFKLYAYDPTAGKMLLYNRGATHVFDTASGDWEPATVETPFGGGDWVPKFCTTPEGVAVWAPPVSGKGKDAGALWRFDAAARAWKRLATTGEPVPVTPNGDGGTLAYDSKRGRLLLFASAGAAWGCDLAGGAVARLAPTDPGAAPGFVRESVYLPAGDLVLFADARGGGATVYDVGGGRFRTLELANPSPVDRGAGYGGGDCGLTYDPGRGLVWAVYSRQRLRVLRFDPKAARFDDRVR